MFGFFLDLAIRERAGNPHANLRALALTPMWPYVRGISVFGGRPFVAAALAALADHHHPWLRRLSILVRDGLVPARTALATPAIAAELIDNTPILDAVQIRGRRVFEAFPHPAVTSWSLSHVDTIVSRDRDVVTLRAPHRPAR